MKTIFIEKQKYFKDKKINKEVFDAIVSNWTKESEESKEILERNIEVVHGIDSNGKFTIEIYLDYDNMLQELYSKKE